MLPKSLRPYAAVIEDVSDERQMGDGYWVYLKKGYYWDDPGLHIVHEDTITECVRCLKERQVCTCHECSGL